MQIARLFHFDASSTIVLWQKLALATSRLAKKELKWRFVGELARRRPLCSRWQCGEIPIPTWQPFVLRFRGATRMTTTTTTSPQPEQGQMVSVRSRNWMVTDVSASTLPPERLQTGLESPQHLLTLSSVEDDGLGEELQVIWELEPGARVVEKVALPDPTGFDPPDRLAAFLDAVRWGASSSP